MSDQSVFDSAYKLSQPTEVQALMASQDDFEARETRAAELATKGFTIDVPIMVWQWDPYLVMKMRKDYGYTWVPAALQPNVSIAPNVSQPGTVAYDPDHAPAGSIKVSTDPADFPPFVMPVHLNVEQPTTDLVGPQSVGSLYLTVVGDSSPDGKDFTDARGEFVKHVVLTPFGRNAWWTLVKAA